MKIIKIWNDDPSEKQISEIAGFLAEGEIAIIPTDTIYAIVCDALNIKAIERICRLKGINPEKTNLSIICSDISMAAEYARFDNYAFKLLKENTPGPFTFLFRSASTLPRAFKGRKIVGVRIPDNRLCRELSAFLKRPLLTTSVELDDEDYARNPDLLEERYDNRVDILVKGEEGGLEPSTIVDCTSSEPEIIRQGKGWLK